MERNRNVNIAKGVAAGIILLLGIVFIIGFNQGFFNIDESTLWIFIAVVGVLVVLALSGIILIPRTRINKYPSRVYGVSESNQYKPFEKTEFKENKDFVPSRKVSSGDAKFCDYCGITLEENLRFCNNCGNKIQ